MNTNSNSTFTFWKSWSAAYRQIWFFLLLLLLTSVALCLFYYVQGYEGIISWGTREEQKVIESVLHEFTIGSFTVSVPGENYAILSHMEGGAITPNVFAYHVSLFLFFTGAVVLMALISTLDRFWAIVGTALCLLFVYSLRLPSLLIMGTYGYVPALILAGVLLSLMAYFNIISNSIALTTRLAAFAGVFTLAGVIIFFTSSVETPFLYLSVTTYPAIMVLSLLFIILVAHEIPSWIAVFASGGASGGRNIRHFLVFSLIYLINLVLAALHAIQIIEWDFVYVNAYLLLIVSAILGVWGFRDRESLYGSILPFHPSGALLYLSLALICFGAVTQFLGNMNDAALGILEDIILFAHTGYGLLFVLYVLSNFIDLMGNNISIGKVLYKPTRMPYLSYQLAGLIATLGFVFYAGWREYTYDGMGGFYNQLGDVDLVLNNETFARSHFEQARSYAFRDHHSNYAMAQLNAQSFEVETSREYYQRANAERPTEFSAINEGNTWFREGKSFEAIRHYRRLLERYPASAQLQNNLGVAYGKVYNLDSSLFFLEQARQSPDIKAIAETNFLSFLATESFPIKADSIVRLFQSDDPGVLANALALAAAQHQEFNVNIKPFPEGRLNLYTATLLNNYLVRNVKRIDSVSLKRAFEIASDSLNSNFEEALKVPIASAYYFQGNVTKALEIMAGLIYRSRLYEGSYNYFQGLWALEQGNPEAAAFYFDYAFSQRYKKAQLYQAIAWSEAGDPLRATLAWDSLSRSGDEGEKAMAAVMKQLMAMSFTEALNATDPVRYQYCHYRLSVNDTLPFNRMVASMQDAVYKSWTLYEMAKRQFEWDNVQKSVDYLERIPHEAMTDPMLEHAVKRLRLLILMSTKNIELLENELQGGFSYFQEELHEERLLQATRLEARQDTVEATRLYRLLGQNNPFFEEGIIAAADYFRTHGTDRMLSYDLLANAIQMNTTSPKLFRAYIEEARRAGFEWYAASAQVQLNELMKKKGRGEGR